MKTKRIISLLLALLMFFTVVGTEVYAATKEELENKIEQLDGQIAANKNKLNALKGKKEKQKEYLETLEKQLDTVEEKATSLQVQVNTLDKSISKLDKQINTLSKDIKKTKKQIKKAEDDIVTMEETIENTSDRMAEKLRASYMKGSESTLQILMGADSLASFMTRLEMMKRTSEKDKKDIEDFRDTVVSLKDTRKQLISDKKALDEKREERKESKEKLVNERSALKKKQKEYNSTVSQLENQYDEVEDYVKELDKSSAAYESYIKKLEKEKKAADAEIDRIIKEYYQNQPTGGNANGSYDTSSSWAWPLGSASCYISSHYGYRNPSISGWGFHGGIDIVKAGGGSTGCPIVAAASGRVITAISGYYGYGHTVVIDHGNGLRTRYAHMQPGSIIVRTCQYIYAGQQLGRLGGTGNVTGPHLHFEVLKYGTKVNPYPYIRKGAGRQEPLLPL